MVHALEEIRRLLRPSGTLIEIHPVRGAWVEVRSGADIAFTEPDPGFDSDDELEPTEEAVKTVVRRNQFALEREREFNFLTHASSVAELRGYFAMVGGYDEGPSDGAVTRLRDELYGRAQQVLDRSAGDVELVYREEARMSRLTPVVGPTGSSDQPASGGPHRRRVNQRCCGRPRPWCSRYW
jgi:SAM-dependent methyltransferase